MIKINTEELSSEQVNAIILLVNENNGSVYATEQEGKLKLDLSRLWLLEKVMVFRKMRQIKKGESST